MIIKFSNNRISKKDEKILIINIVGVLEILGKGYISINESEKFLFSPHVVNKLKTIKCDIKIIEILELGCELEDIASLLPHKLATNIDELKQKAIDLIKSYAEFDKSFWF